MPKRSSSSSPDLSDSDNRPGSSPITSDYEDVKPSPAKRAKPTKAKAKKDTSQSPATPNQGKGAWKASEDAIFVELMSKLVTENAWLTVKEDGRLEYRGRQGVRAHAIALMNKVKKDVGEK